MTAKLTDAELKRTAKALIKYKGDRPAAARALGLEPSSITTRVTQIRHRFPDIVIPKSKKTRPLTDAQNVADAVAALAEAGSQRGAARRLGIPYPTLQHRLAEAERRTDWLPLGSVTARKAVKRPLPKGRKIARYLLTAAQSDTKLHDPTWKALQALAAHYKAEVLVSTFTYRHRQEGSAKRGSAGAEDTDWYDPRIEPFVVDEMVELAPGLVWNGHMNILPTATDPLSGMDSYNGRASSIFPHAKVALKSVPAMQGSGAKLQYTTGACTQLNYIAKKAGQKAEFDHVFGALIVEVNSAGQWWARQLSTDKRGRIFDLDVCATETMTDGDYWVVCPSLGASALVFGDIHVAQLEPKVYEEIWGEKGMVAALRPDYQVMHDVLDFESRSHHNRRDPHKMFDLHVRKRESVQTEVAMVGEFLKTAALRGGRVVVVSSNHDRHLERWLKEADWRTDMANAEFYMACQQAFLASLRGGKSFDALKWAVGKYNAAKGVRFLANGESFVVCRDAAGGIELGLHGDQGPNGSRGSVRNLARIGRKVVIGHSHSAAIHLGAWQTGVTAKLGMDYARGAPSSWSRSHVLVHLNGKRQMITSYGGKWRA